MNQCVQAYLSTLPTCHQFVLVVAPEFGEGEYSCSIILPANDLLAWYRKDVEQTFVYSWDAKLRRRALPLWLEQACPEDGGITELPSGAFHDIRGSITDWVEEGHAHVWCYHCESWADDIAMSRTDESQIGNLSRSWTDLWFCNQGVSGQLK